MNENTVKLIENSTLVNKDPEDMDSIQNYIYTKNQFLKNKPLYSIEYFRESVTLKPIYFGTPKYFDFYYTKIRS
jgi:hypothetical protein